MKKTYLLPTIKWMEAETEEMIASTTIENGFNLSDVDDTNETSGNLARRNSVWGDDEE